MLSVVMPAHNEAGYLETAVTDVDEGMRARGHELEILVVENGSTDHTLAIARRLADERPADSGLYARRRRLRRSVA